MARPRKEGMDYFPHDVDAAGDEKVEALTALYGAEGYAFYFILLERIYRTNNFELDVSDAETLQILSRKCLTTPDNFAKMLETALKIGCFDREVYRSRGVLTSSGIKKRSKPITEKRAVMRIAAQKRVTETETPPVIPPVTTPETPQSKAKESKVKQSIAVTSPADEGGSGFEQYLRMMWGKEGNVGWGIIQQFIELARKHTWPAVYEAVNKAAQANVKKLNYVKACLEPKPKPGPVTGPSPPVKKWKCPDCHLEMPETKQYHHWDVCPKKKQANPERVRDMMREAGI